MLSLLGFSSKNYSIDDFINNFNKIEKLSKTITSTNKKG